MDKEIKYHSLDELPLSLNAEDIADVLHISKTKAYCLLHREDFPVIRIGKRMIVPKSRFLAWLESQQR